MNAPSTRLARRRARLLGVATFLIFASLFLGCQGDSPAAPSTSPSTRPTTLAGYLDKVLDAEDERAIAKLYKDLTGENLASDKDNLAVSCIARFESGDARFVLLRSQSAFFNPGTTYFEAIVFDGNWRKIARKVILAGYCVLCGGATVEHNDIVGCDLLVARAGPFPIPRVPASESAPASRPEHEIVEYTGFRNGEFHLVRIESEAKEPIERFCGWCVPTMGVKPPKLTKAEWIQRLESSDIIVRLGALSWVTGEHLPTSEGRYEGINQESLEDASIFESVRDDPATQRILSATLFDRNPWARGYWRFWLEQEAGKK